VLNLSEKTGNRNTPGQTASCALAGVALARKATAISAVGQAACPCPEVGGRAWCWLG
jgi:hypothetical protein